MGFDDAMGRRVAVDLVRVITLLKTLGPTVRAQPVATGGNSPAAGIEPGSHPVLFAVRNEPCRVTEIAERVRLDVSVVSRHVSALESRGLVSKSADPRDGRAWVVRLTGAGERLVEDIIDARGRWLSELLHDWTPEQAEDFDAHLGRLVAALDTELAARTRADDPQENR